MAASGFQHLTLDERRSLFRMREARLGVAEMASRLGRHRSTISPTALLSGWQPRR